jgi:hypothetical protein
MNVVVSRAVKVGFWLSAALGVAVYFSTGLRTVFLDAYLIAIGGVLLLALVRTTRVKAPAGRVSPFDQALERMSRRTPDSGDLTLVRDLDLSILSAFHLHVRVRPLLREIAAHRLRARYGVDLDDEPGRARELVGTSAWELVRPQRPPPDDRLAAGPSLSHLADVATELEEI